jgi:hypothetical protein
MRKLKKERKRWRGRAKDKKGKEEKSKRNSVKWTTKGLKEEA